MDSSITEHPAQNGTSEYSNGISQHTNGTTVQPAVTDGPEAVQTQITLAGKVIASEPLP